MKPETEQTLATLEVILENPISYSLPCHEDSADFKPYIWDTNIQGKFTPLNLIKHEGWIEETDPEVVVDSWIKLEQNGLASNLIYVYGNDPENILLDSKNKNFRYQCYCELLEVLIDNIEELQGFNITYNTHYSLFIISGLIQDNQNWICLSAKVPQETPEYINDLIYGSPYIKNYKINIKDKAVSETEIKINNILKKLDMIRIYGYYDGGYCHIHDFRVICSLGDTKEDAINRALTASGLVEIYKFERFSKRGSGGWGFSNYFDTHEQYLADFLHKNFSELLVYRFCFWDYEHLYILGEKGDRDRLGISLHSQFTYNP
jgi:hypothetical protein